MDKNENLRNEIDVDVHYISDKGEKSIKTVHIAFVTQGIYKEYTSLVQDLLEVVRLNERLENITQEMGHVIAHRADVVTSDDGDLKTVHKSISEIREDIKKLQSEYDDIIARLNGLSDQTTEKKYALIAHILRKNGISDKDMMSAEWWEEYTDMPEAMKFIHDVCRKDDDNIMNKKKLPVMEKSST